MEIHDGTKIERLQRSSYRLTVHEPVEPDDSITDEREKAVDMIRRVNEHFEAWIRERPDQWFCSKSMWPKPAKHAG